MRKLYRIITLLVLLVFLTTYTPNEFDVIAKTSNPLFKIQNIEDVFRQLKNVN